MNKEPRGDILLGSCYREQYRGDWREITWRQR